MSNKVKGWLCLSGFFLLVGGAIVLISGWPTAIVVFGMFTGVALLTRGAIYLIEDR